MAPIAQYLSADVAGEIALARSAAPPAIAGNAEIRVLQPDGYRIEVPGRNGFVCLVERSWAKNFDSSDFWNPKIRAPHCFNAAAARSVLPGYLLRTAWVVGGVPRRDMPARTAAAVAAHEMGPPESGSLAYMMSKQGYLGDDAGGPWHPHLMFFMPRMADDAWGANVQGSPIFADSSGPEQVTVFFVPVRRWSDGTPD
ncbi:MAG: hypothetical protein JO361_04885 [Gammaproteobacteria bacterium]|nr:hypothetical protein [Gammaproteobacteria bacterium]